MKKELLNSVLLSLFVLIAAQVTAREPFIVSKPRLPTDATVPGQQILVSTVPLDKCPQAAPPWHGRFLFQTAEAEPSEPLRHFCEYRFQHDAVARPDQVEQLERDLFCPGGLPAESCVPPPTAKLEPDHLVIVPLTSLPDVVAPALRDRFAYRAGEGTWPAAIGGLPPRLALLDTAPTSTAPGMIASNSPHGDSLIHLAHVLLCDNGSENNFDCLAQITSQLALPYLEYDRVQGLPAVLDEVLGGFLGTKADLAKAIHAQVDAWQKEEADRNLIINLSVAWDPMFGDAAPPGSTLLGDPGAEAVHAAILDARCQGALVVAASGNRVGGPEGPPSTAHGAMLPAAWELRPISDEYCLDAEAPMRSTTPVPLVYAAGGVDLDHQTLPNARPQSEPPRVAYADHAYAQFAPLQAPSSALTGSSVASLVVSATAAAAWRFQPTLSADQIMTLVYDSGTPLTGSSGPRFADVYFPGWGSPPNVRLADLCSAVTQACAQGGTLCVASPDCSTTLPSQVNWSPFDATVPPAHQVSFHQLSMSSFGSSPPVPPPHDCGDLPLYVPIGIDLQTDAVCPGRQFYSASATPWTGPQPEQDLCPGCVHSQDPDPGPSSPGGSLLSGQAAQPRLPPRQAAEAFGLPADKSSFNNTLRIEIPSPIVGTFGAPTLVTSKGIYRFRESDWPCMEPGDRCVIADVPHDGEGPIELSFSVNPVPGSTPCEPAVETCWSVTKILLHLQ